MKRTIKIVVAFLLAAASAQQPNEVWGGQDQVSANQACRALESSAREILGKAEASGEAFQCQPNGSALIVSASSKELLDGVESELFPQGRYKGYPIEKTTWNDSQAQKRDGKPSRSLIAAKVAAELVSTGVLPNFDHAVSGSEGLLLAASEGFAADGLYQGNNTPIVLAQAPPGHKARPKPAPVGDEPPPPGHKPRPKPGGGDDAPPPGHRPRPQPGGGDDVPPPSSGGRLPEKVEVRMMPAPPAAWWNTHWSEVSIWDNPLSDYGSDTPDFANRRYVTRWYPLPRLFSDRGRSRDVQNVARRQGQDNLYIALKSQEIITLKDCYYRARYVLTLDRYNGRWNADFDHYDAACYVYRQYGFVDQRTVNVQFQMRGQSLLPWEQETVEASYDGLNVNVSVGNPAFQYVQAYNNGFVSVFEAGAKLLTSPDPNGVGVQLVQIGGRSDIALRVTDNRASYHAGEVLELTLSVWRKGAHFWNQDSKLYAANGQSPLRISIPVGADNVLLSDFPIPDSYASGRYYVYDWSFRRVNSRISSGNWLGKGSTDPVSK
jgi:hypothetical protein